MRRNKVYYLSNAISDRWQAKQTRVVLVKFTRRTHSVCAACATREPAERTTTTREPASTAGDYELTRGRAAPAPATARRRNFRAARNTTEERNTNAEATRHANHHHITSNNHHIAGIFSMRRCTLYDNGKYNVIFLNL